MKKSYLVSANSRVYTLKQKLTQGYFKFDLVTPTTSKDYLLYLIRVRQLKAALP